MTGQSTPPDPFPAPMCCVDPFKACTIRLQFAAFVPAVEATAPRATFATPTPKSPGREGAWGMCRGQH